MNVHHPPSIQTVRTTYHGPNWHLRCIALYFFALAAAQGLDLSDLPSPVQEAIKTLSQGASISSAGSSRVLGETLVEAKITRDGVERLWTLDSHGVPLHVTILSKEAPAAVQKAIQNQAAKAGALNELLRTYEGGKVVYEATFQSPGGETSYTFDGAGVITSREIPLTQVPPRVLKRSSGALKGAAPIHCHYSEEDHEPYFTFSTAQSNGPRWVTLDAKGDLSEEEELVAFEQIPEPVQSAIIGRLGGKEHARTLQKKDDESTHFEVWAFHGGKLNIFWVSTTGTISDVPPEP